MKRKIERKHKIIIIILLLTNVIETIVLLFTLCSYSTTSHGPLVVVVPHMDALQLV